MKAILNHVGLARVHVCLVTQLCPTLCNTRVRSPPDASVLGILQTGTLEWVVIPSDPDPGIEPASSVSPALTSRFFTF